MVKEIYIVEVINGEDLESYIQAFEDVKEAEQAFINEVRKRFEDNKNPFTEEDLNAILEDGYYADDTHYSVLIKDIVLKTKN